MQKNHTFFMIEVARVLFLEREIEESSEEEDEGSE